MAPGGGLQLTGRGPSRSSATDRPGDDDNGPGHEPTRPRRRLISQHRVAAWAPPHPQQQPAAPPGTWSSNPVAGVTVACLLVGWGIVGVVAGFPSWWQVALYSTTSAVTVVMVFAIQHTQHREQLVTQRKLDELVRAQPGADDRLIAAEAATDAELDDLIEANDN